MESAVRTVALRKEYQMGAQTLRVLKDVDIEIASGEIVCVMGPSGSGKSTLLNLVGGLDTPTSGSIVVDGADLATMDDGALARHRRAPLPTLCRRVTRDPRWVLTCIGGRLAPAQRSGLPS